MLSETAKIKVELKFMDDQILNKDRENEELQDRLNKVEIVMGPLKTQLLEQDLLTNRKKSQVRQVEHETGEKSVTYQRIQDRCYDLNGQIDLFQE
jgi:hypothetical protein